MKAESFNIFLLFVVIGGNLILSTLTRYYKETINTQQISEIQFISNVVAFALLIGVNGGVYFIQPRYLQRISNKS